MLSQITFKQLLYFKNLAESGHYRKAAERVGISQPSLSLQIGNLEKALKLTLVERGRAGAVLTPEGREVLAKTRDILSEIEALQETASRMKEGLAGTLRLGSSPTLGPYLLPQVLQELHRTYPALGLVIRDGPPSDLLLELLRGEHDLILTQLPVMSDDVHFVRLFREPLHLTVAIDHPLAGRKLVKDEDIEGEDVLVLANRFTLHSQVAQMSEELGANLRRDYEGTSLDALRQMTAMNMGVTFLPALYANSEVPKQGGDVSLMPYRKGRLTRSIGLVWRKTRSNQETYETIANLIRLVAKQRFKGILNVDG